MELGLMKLQWGILKLKIFRLLAFNLGYLPGEDKTIVIKSNMTLVALQAASIIVEYGGLIRI